MFRNIIKRTLALNIRSASTAAINERWDLCVGVLIERLPILTQKLNSIESEVMKTFTQLEFEGSLKSDHELRREKDIRQEELIKAGKLEIELDSDARSLQTAQDFEDLNQEELSKFNFAPRETEDDKINNVKSHNRKLDDTLMLLCEERVDKVEAFLLPQAQWAEGETLRQTAERIVKEKLGGEIKVHFYGHAPCGFYKYKYKSGEQSDAVGAKTFFYRAALKAGNVQDKNMNFEWVNEEQLKGKVRSSYYASVSQFLHS